MPNMQLTEINGIELELFDGGNPNGEPVFYIHGGGSVEFQAASREPLLTDQFRLIYIHRRGYGGSQAPDPSMSIEDNAVDIRAALEHLGIEKAQFVSQSSGSIILLQYMLDYPETVHSATLMEPPFPWVIGNEPEYLETMEKAGSLYEAGDKAGAVDAFHVGVGGKDYYAQFDANLPDGWFDQLVTDIDTIVQVESHALESWTFSKEHAARINQPVLNVTGARTRPYLRVCHETVKSWIPHAENPVLPNTTHALMETNPKSMAELLANFFSRHPIQ
jgi:pimeloyl-ACP methyl ester carboxylesterase